MKTPLAVVLIGCGKMGQSHLQELKKIDTPYKIVGLFDAMPAIAEKLAKQLGVPTYSSIDELCANTKPDIAHVCTPPRFHYENAVDLIRNNVNVYIEKPFVEHIEQANELFDMAHSKGLILCAGFQQIFDPAFEQFVAKAKTIGETQQLESKFYFSPARFSLNQASGNMLADQLLDILPHPLYTLVETIRRLKGSEAEIGVTDIAATPSSVFAVLNAGDLQTQLDVSLNARPVSSTVTVAGESGSISADFVRSILFGNLNSGTLPLEKILNPLFLGAQLQFRSTWSFLLRLIKGNAYPGLASLFEAFYQAVQSKSESPVDDKLIRDVVAIYEEIAKKVHKSIPTTSSEQNMVENRSENANGDRVLVTGAGGMLGIEICRELMLEGCYVTGLGRTDKSHIVPANDWVSMDIHSPDLSTVLENVDVVIHAAAETSGGYEDHQRNSIDATRTLIEAMKASKCQKLIFISSVAVLETSSTRSNKLTESTRLSGDSAPLGAYIWGKRSSEKIVAQLCGEYGIDYRIIRPAALVSYDDPGVPGRLGKRLYGDVYLGLGRKSLPFGACEVDTAGRAIAWYVSNFSSAPNILNLVDGAISSRGELIARYRAHGRKMTLVWFPISVLSAAISTIKSAMGLIRGGEKSDKISTWDVLKPRYYDSTLSDKIIADSKSSKPMA